MTEMEAKIREILTPEQQVKFDAGIKKMHEEMEKRGGRRHGWEGGQARERTGGVGMRTIRRGCAIGACALLCWAGACAGAARASESRAITLKSAIETALKANVDLRQAANQTESQEISVRSSTMDFFPSLRLSLGASRGYGKD